MSSIASLLLQMWHETSSLYLLIPPTDWLLNVTAAFTDLGS